MLKLICLFALSLVPLCAQSNSLILCDQQVTASCFTLAPASVLAWEGFSAQNAGLLTGGYGLAGNAAATAGGYFDVAPIAYSPSPGYSCFDAFGNPVSQPFPLNTVSAFGVDDVVMWNSTSPLQGYHAPFSTGSTGSTLFVTGVTCAVPVPVISGSYGLNLNAYVFALQGFATAIQAFNAIEVFEGGGMAAQSFTATGVYPAGTQLRSGFTVNAGDHTTVLDSAGRVGNQYGTNLGGYMYTGFSDQNPGNTNTYGSECRSIGMCDNPLIAGVTLAPGEISFNTALRCEVVYSGTSWGCIGNGYILSTVTPTSPSGTVTGNNNAWHIAVSSGTITSITVTWNGTFAPNACSLTSSALSGNPPMNIGSLSSSSVTFTAGAAVNMASSTVYGICF